MKLFPYPLPPIPEPEELDDGDIYEPGEY